MAERSADSQPGQRAAVIAGLLGLIPALALGLVLFMNQEPPEVREQLLGNLVFALILASPYLLALAVSRLHNPAARGALLLALGLLSVASVFSALSGVTVILLPAAIALFVAAIRSLRGAGRQILWAPLFLIPGLLGAAAIGFSFYALFQVQEDEPRCWVLKAAEGREEWQTLAVPTPNETGGITMGPFGPEVRRSLCTSDIITNQEGALGLGGVGVGVMVLLVASLIFGRFPHRDGSAY